MDTVNDWPGIHLPANECDGITRRSCNDGVCAGCPVFYVYNVDEAAAKMTSCRAHRKLYAQDILVDRMPVDRMELQIKFAGFAVITTDAVRWMKNIIQDLPCVEVGAGHGLITSEPTTWGMLPTMRHGIIAKRLTSTLHQSAARAWNAKGISSSMNCPSGTNGSSGWTQSSPIYRTKSFSQNETPPS